MLKYVDIAVTFSEIPDEITLCINLSNCPNHCEGCHSPYLADDIGEVLTFQRIKRLLNKNSGVTCVCFMGGDNDTKLLNYYAKLVQYDYNAMFSEYGLYPVKVAWYSGRQELNLDIDLSNFDYIKLGPYNKDLGPLNSPTTNQRLYKVIGNKLKDITFKFWKNETNN